MNSSLQDINASNAHLLMLFFLPQHCFVFISGTYGFHLRHDRVKVYQKAFSEGTGILRVVPIFFLLWPPSHLPLKNSPFFMAGIQSSLCQIFSLPDFWEAL